MCVCVCVLCVCIYIYTCYWVRRGVYRDMVGKPEGRKPPGDLGVDGWIVLGWISRRWDLGIWTGLGWPRIERGVGRL